MQLQFPRLSRNKIILKGFQGPSKLQKNLAFTRICQQAWEPCSVEMKASTNVNGNNRILCNNSDKKILNRNNGKVSNKA